jgi:acyl carrier protein
MDIKDTIVGFIVSHFIKGEEPKDFEDISFLEEGIIDSVGVLELIVFLEETFSLNVEDEEIIPDNLDSVSKLVAFVQSKLANK